MNPQAAASAEVDAATARETLSPAVGTVRITYPDLHGIQRGKDIPVSELDRAAGSGLAFCWAVMGTDLSHTPVVGGEAGYPDMVAKPDLSTLRELPWEPDVAVCLADLEREGDPEPTDLRGLVRRASDELAELGLAAKIGPELEFFLLEPDGEGGWRRHVDTLSMVYTVGPQADPQGVVKALLEGCAALGLGAIASNHEFMNSQYEINLREARPARGRRPRLPVQGGRQGFRRRSAGLLATFMGKPFNDQGGSGTHLHISLERDGRTARRRRAATRLSAEHAPLRRRAARARAGADGVPQPDRQRVPAGSSPTAWPPHTPTGARQPHHVRARATGGRLRLAASRSGSATGPRTRTCHRGVLFAGLDGLRASSIRPAACRRHLHPPRGRAGRPALPMSLSEALDALEADTVIRDAVGPDIVDTFLAMKRFELERYRQHVSDWDLIEYMRHL